MRFPERLQPAGGSVVLALIVVGLGFLEDGQRIADGQGRGRFALARRTPTAYRLRFRDRSGTRFLRRRGRGIGRRLDGTGARGRRGDLRLGRRSGPEGEQEGEARHPRHRPEGQSRPQPSAPPASVRRGSSSTGPRHGPARRHRARSQPARDPPRIGCRPGPCRHPRVTRSPASARLSRAWTAPDRRGRPSASVRRRPSARGVRSPPRPAPGRLRAG